MPDRIRITDVSPRDGLQNEPGVIPTAHKVRLVELLSRTGVDEIEVTSFVSPKWVPQLGDAASVLWNLHVNRDIDIGTSTRGNRPAWKTNSPMLSALIPNERGFDSLMDIASDVGMLIEKISLFTAASETFNKKNTNATIAESIERFRPVVDRARSLRLLVRGYISCVVACPFEGAIAPAAVANVAEQLVDLGVDEIDLGDTIGAGTPDTTRAMLHAVTSAIGPAWLDADSLTLHLHDTFHRAADCVKAALDLGVRSFDGSVAGLGGCPYASTPTTRAPGNIDTALLVRTIHNAGFTTGVDLNALDAAAHYAREIVAASRADSIKNS